MDKKQWKYKIGSGKTPVILMFIMSALFVSLTIWLYSEKNGVFIFAGLISISMVLVLVLTIYRFLFYKVLIGKDGFYYQTNPGNGKYYDYSEIEKAWISSGLTQNGVQSEYCNVKTPSGAVIRFPFFRDDKKGVKYLIKKVDNVPSRRIETIVDEKREYFIDGKLYGKIQWGIMIVVLIMAAVLDTILTQISGTIYLVIPTIIMAVAIVWMFVMNYFCFKVQIGGEGFYCRTNLFDGRFYKYKDISECKEIKKVVRRHAVGRPGRASGMPRYYFYFQFTDKKGTTRKFRFEKPIYEHEVNVLKERIEKATSVVTESYLN